MKEGIHPEYKEIQISCACGEKFTTKSTRKSMHTEICSKCHPFYTGKQKIIDAEGRISKFNKKYAAAK